jgi:hypothetical protein
MGVLDDAIKEHLELKRKHGAAEEELQRQEEEALGPARRDVAQQHKEEADSAVAVQDGPLFDADDDPPPEPAEVAEAAQEPTAVEPPPVEPPAAVETDVPALSEEPPVAGQPPVGQEPDIGSHAPEESELEPEDARLGDTQPHGFDALDKDEEEPPADDADLPVAEPEPEPEDVLEDTPDFLQETPEHDRLWFEQKPPRDFDFD